MGSGDPGHEPSGPHLLYHIPLRGTAESSSSRIRSYDRFAVESVVSLGKFRARCIDFVLSGFLYIGKSDTRYKGENSFESPQLL